ncbi:hypothetical protein FRC07_008876, partial [Ceratobasidium sp. 392]
YGFIFYRDSGWVDVIIDDLLYTKIPKFEELWGTENAIYHDDKDLYERHARKGSKTLFFGKSKTENETWVPLLEKAYAKLHGDYNSLNGGFESEAIEDMTGGLSTIFHIHDILDTDKFWNEQLLRANKDRLFGCYIYPMAWASEVKGLHTLHAYSILDALEVAGKRFLRIRNPWGESEWKGRWSDGSKEWTSEWLARLPELKHKFGDDGEFLMEYSDFLKTWTMVERSRLFESDWKLSSMWMNVTSRSFPCAWNFGDVSFTMSIPEDTPAVIVLSQLDDRYFSELSGYSSWSMDFVVYKKGAPAEEVYTRSTHTVFWRRSVNVELDHLEAGEYVVHVRLDRDKLREKTFYKDNVDKWNPRKLSKVWAEACLSKSIAVNFNPEAFGDLLPASVGTFGGEDLTSLELSHYEKIQTKLPPPLDVVAAPLAMESTTLADPETKTSKPDDTEARSTKEGESETKDTKEEGSEKKDTKAEDGEAKDGKVEDSDAKDSKATNEEASSESSSAVIVDPVAQSENEGEDTKSPAGPSSKPGSSKRPTSENKDDDDKEDKPEKKDDKDTDKKDEKKDDKKDDKDDKKDEKKDDKDDKKDEAKDEKNEKDANKDTTPKGPDEVIHEGYSCDECRTSPIVGPRYHCLNASCHDYDICSKCMDAGKHDSTHTLLCIRNPADANKIRDDVAEGEDNSITLGLKVYTKGSAVATVAGQLRHGKVVGSWKKKAKA